MAAKFSRNVLYGPGLYDGLDIQCPYYKQGITKIITCIQNCAIASQTGKLIITLPEEFMLEKGMPMTLGAVN